MNKLILTILAVVATITTAKAESTLTVVPRQITAWVENFNPFNQTTMLQTTLHFVYEPLVIFNSMKGGRAEYRLATKHSYANDLKSVTFDIRKGVKWSDGQEFNADDIAFSFDLAKNNKAIDIEAIWKIIDGYEVINSHKVKFNLKEANTNAAFKIVNVPIVAEHAWKDVKDPITFTNKNPIGTGPMTQVKRFTPQVYVQCRNPHYWDNDNLAVDCLRMPQLANNEQVLAAAQKGKLDWFGSFLPDISKTYIAHDSANHKYWFPGGSLVAFNFNLESQNPGNKKAFNDVNFRRAMSMAMDRESMVEIAGNGYPTINRYASSLGKAYDSWNNKAAQDKFGKYAKLNIAAAKQLLATAGFKDVNGDGYVQNSDGSDIKFNVIVPNGWTDWVNTVQIAVEGLQEIGINAKVSTPEAPVWTKALIDGTYDAGINAYFTGVTPHRQYDTAFNSRNIDKTRFSATRFTTPELDTALNAFTQTNNTADKRKYMDKIQYIIAENTPYIGVFNNPMWYEYNTARFTGFFNANNPGGDPTIFQGNPVRLLHLLSIKPK